MFGLLEYSKFNFQYCCFAYKIKSRRLLLKTMAIFLNFVVKTAPIWLILAGFFWVLSESETICNLHSCYKFALVLQKNCTPFSANQNWVIFSCILLVLKNCEILHSVRGLYDKQASDVLYKKYKRLIYTPPDLLARFCKVNLFFSHYGSWMWSKMIAIF